MAGHEEGRTKEDTMSLTLSSLTKFVSGSKPQQKAVGGQHTSASMQASKSAPMTTPAPQPGWTPARQPRNIPKLPLASHQRFATIREFDQRMFHMQHAMKAMIRRWNVVEHNRRVLVEQNKNNIQKAQKELTAFFETECTGMREWFKRAMEQEYSGVTQPPAAHPEVPVSAPPSFPVVNTRPEDALQQLKAHQNLTTPGDRHGSPPTHFHIDNCVIPRQYGYNKSGRTILYEPPR
jgi:hypothetical protein